MLSIINFDFEHLPQTWSNMVHESFSSSFLVMLAAVDVSLQPPTEQK